jgi:hypothetical protein
MGRRGVKVDCGFGIVDCGFGIVDCGFGIVDCGFGNKVGLKY